MFVETQTLAVVHGDLWWNEDCFSTFPMATKISLRRGGLFFLKLLHFETKRNDSRGSPTLEKSHNETLVGRKKFFRASGGQVR